MKKKTDDNLNRWENLVWEPHKYNERKKIKSSTYLRSFCPHCNKKLTQGNILTLDIIGQNEEKGKIELSPYLNVFDHHTDITIPEGKEIKDLLCPFCHKSLRVNNKKCDRCDSNVASFNVGSTIFKVPFFICMRLGCHWHAISPEHTQQIILEDSNEW
jgi:hypothetical protein